MGGNASIEMRVYHSTGQLVKRGRQGTEEMRLERVAATARVFPGATGQFKAKIANVFFCRAPRKLKTA